jgi:hypothetical protein
MEKQPDSRMCFVCGVDNPIGLDGAPSACTQPSTPITSHAASRASGPSPTGKVIRGSCTGGSYAPFSDDDARSPRAVLRGASGQALHPITRQQAIQPAI